MGEYGTEGLVSLFKSAKEGSLGDLAQAYNAVYQVGYKGKDISEARNPYISLLSPEQAGMAFYIGQMDRFKTGTSEKVLPNGAESGTIEKTQLERETSYGKVDNGRDGRRRSSKHAAEQVAEGSRRVPMVNRSSSQSRVVTREGGKRIFDTDSEGIRIRLEIIDQIADTALLDEQGRPIAVYHSTDADFDVFNKGDIGFHFGNIGQAKKRARDKGLESPKYIRAYLNIKNPIMSARDTMSWNTRATTLNLWSMDILTDSERAQIEKLDCNKSDEYNSPAAIRLREILESKGYDGIAYPNGYEGEGLSYIAFHDEQIIRVDDGKLFLIDEEGGVDSEESIYLRNSGEWNGSENPGGQISAVEGGARQDQSREESGSKPRDREAASLTYGKEVSAKSLGIEGGLDSGKVYLIAEGNETTAMKKARKRAEKRGKKVTFFAGGNLEVELNGETASVRGYIKGDDIYVRADHPYFTSDQLMRHEIGHDMIANGEVDITRVRERIEARYEDVDFIVEQYSKAYEGSGLDADEIWEEIICDSLGDMNIFASVEALGEINEEFLSQLKGEIYRSAKDARGPPRSAEGKASRENAKRRPKVPPMNEFATNAMQWAYSSKTEIGEQKLFYRKGKWVLLEKTDDGYIEIATYTPKQYDFISKEISKHNEKLYYRGTDERIHRSVVLYESIGSDDSRDNRDDVGQQARDGSTGGLHQGESESNRSGDNKEGKYDSRHFSQELDIKYLSAVERGDMETAQRMVDEAAKKAGFTVKGYHGTPGEVFTKFDNKKIGSNTDSGIFGHGFYFSTDENTANIYATEKGNIMPVFLNVGKAWWAVAHRNIQDVALELGIDETALRLRGYGGKGQIVTPTMSQARQFSSHLQEKGYDSVVVQHGKNNYEIVIFNPERIKSSDPVTYDDDGNVIPLSQRFINTKTDIRFSRDLDFVDFLNENINERERSNREVLANLLESEDMSPSEKGFLTKYKNKIAQIEANEAEIAAMARELAELRKAGKGDSSRAITLESRIEARRKEIARDENIILNLEATKHIKKLLNREREAAYAAGVLAGQMAQGRVAARIIRLREEGLRLQRQRNQEILREYRKRAGARLRAKTEEHRQQLRDVRRQASESLRLQGEELRAHHREVMHQGVVNRSKKALRHDIRKIARELEGLLARGGKKKNVKGELQDATASMVALSEILFSNELKNEDIVRLGVSHLTDSESALVNEYADLLEARDRAQGRLDSLYANPIEGEGYDSDVETLKKEIDRIGRRLSELNGELRDVFARERRGYSRVTVESLIDKLATDYKRLEESDAEHLRMAYNEYVYKRITSLKEELDGTTVKDMTVTQLTAVKDIFSMIRHAVRTSNKLFKNGKLVSLQETAESIMTDLSGTKLLKGERSAFIDAARGLAWSEHTPYYAFRHIGSETLESLYWDLVRSQNTWARDMEEAAAFISDARERHGYKKWDMNKVHEFILDDGRVFRVTLGHMMSIYAHSKREQSVGHMTKGGFFFNDKRTFRKKGGILSVIKSDEVGYRMSEQTIAAIRSAMTSEQIAYVDEAQAYLTEMGEKGNEVSRILYGIDIFKEDVYFPIHSKEDFIARENRTGQYATLANDGMTQETRKGASNPIVLETFDAAWEAHVARMCEYHAYVVPIENLNKVLSYSSESKNGENTKKVLQKQSDGDIIGADADSLRRVENGTERTDEFRELQKRSREMSGEDTSLYHTGSKKIDDEVRGRLSRAFRLELNSAGGKRIYSKRTLLNPKTNKAVTLLEVEGELFHDIFEISRCYLRNGELVDLHDDYNNATCYLTEDGLSGFAIENDGNLVSVFNLSDERGFLRTIAPVIKENATMLDCYASEKQDLQQMYSLIFGFKTTSIMDYNMEYDHDNIAENHGMPKVAFMVNTEAEVETRAFGKDEYKEAVAYQRSFFDDIKENVNSNFPTNSETGVRSVSTMISSRYGSAAMDYLNQLIKDLNGAKSFQGPLSRLGAFLMGNFKKTAVAASLFGCYTAAYGDSACCCGNRSQVFCWQANGQVFARAVDGAEKIRSHSSCKGDGRL